MSLVIDFEDVSRQSAKLKVVGVGGAGRRGPGRDDPGRAIRSYLLRREILALMALYVCSLDAVANT